MGFIEAYEEEMKKFRLPKKLQEQFQVSECLKENDNSWTVVVKKKVSGECYIVKYGRGVFGKLLAREYEILNELEKENIHGIPHPYCLIEEEGDIYFLREYIEGKSLYEFAEENGRISGERIAEIGIVLCRMVQQFQKMKIPVDRKSVV